MEIGGSTIPSHYLLPEILYNYCKKYPDVSVHLSVGDTAEILEKVRSGELIIGVVGATADVPNIEFVPIMRDELVIVAPPVLVRNYDVIDDIQHLAELPWVMREGGSGTRKALEAGLSEMGTSVRELNVTVWVESTQAVVQCVRPDSVSVLHLALQHNRLIDSGELVHISDLRLILTEVFILLTSREGSFSLRFATSLSMLRNYPNSIGKSKRPDMHEAYPAFFVF